MTERTHKLRADLDGLLREWVPTNDGLISIQPTKADVASVEKIAEEMPPEAVLPAIGVLIADALADRIEQSGKRPADYWKHAEMVSLLAKRLGKVLQDNPAYFSVAVQATLKGRG